MPPNPIARLSGLLVLALALPALPACSADSGGGSGGATSAGVAAGSGPRVIVRHGHGQPTLSPFPDDRLARADPLSPTGLRIALPLPSDTTFAVRAQDGFAEMDGFGVLAPMTVTFDAPLDLATVRDDTVFVVNVQPGSSRRGERAPLDLGRGSFPTDLGRPVSYHGRDPFAASGDLLFAPGNGPVHWERATNTLVLRPLLPLEEGARHVVVLTDGVRGASGAPVEGPAGSVRDASDDAVLGALASTARYQWSFTTGRPTLELLALADGVEGRGPFASLAGVAAPRMRFHDLGARFGDGSPYTLDQGPFAQLSRGLAGLARLAPLLGPRAERAAGIFDLVDTTPHAYMAFGEADAPDLRMSADGRFTLDLASGAAPSRPGKVPFLLAVPRPCAENGFARAPYPVLLVGHGNGRSRLDALAIASAAARRGWAILAFDAVGHGPDDLLARLPKELGRAAARSSAVAAAVRAIALPLALALRVPLNPVGDVRDQVDALADAPMVRPFVREGRASDVDGDGVTDSGATFFTVDVFRTRDIVRQTVLDVLAIRRALEGLGVDRNGNGRLDPEEGDLDGDGALDLGGAGRRVAYTGISLGGIVGAVLAAVDPKVERAVLMAPGGGLSDVIVTSDLQDVTGRVFEEAFGAALVGEPDGPGLARVETRELGRIGRVPVAVGGTVVATNSRTGLPYVGTVAADGGFRVHVAVDPGDAVAVESRDPQGALLGSIAFTANASGLSAERCTPRTREWHGFAALALESADPAVFAPLWRMRPAPGRSAKDVLLMVSLGDRTVPTFTGAALARAGGLLSLGRSERMRDAGLFASGTGFHVDRLAGVESTAGAGVRFLGVNSHTGMFAPEPRHGLPGVRYAQAARAMAMEFVVSGRIEDADPVLDLVLP